MSSINRRSSKIVDNGDGTASVELTRGYFATIDSSDIPVVCDRKWHVKVGRKTAYACCTNLITMRDLPMHRLLMVGNELVEGDYCIDHIDLNGLNNRRSNLRFANPTVQKLNQTIRNDNTSGVMGVHMRPNGLWQVRVSVLGKRYSLGHFECFKHAAYCRSQVDKIIEDLLSMLPNGNDLKQAA